MKFNPDAHKGKNTVKNRVVSKGSNEEFGDYLVVNEGTSPMDAKVWYISIEDDGTGRQISQKEIVDTMRKYDREAAKAAELGDDFEETEAPEWVQGVFDQENVEASGEFQLKTQHLWSPEHDTHIFRGDKYSEEEETSYIVTATPKGLQLNCIIQTQDYYSDADWKILVEGKAVLDEEIEERQFGEEIVQDKVVDITDFLLERVGEPVTDEHPLQGEEVVKEYIKGSVEEAELELGEHSFRVEQNKDSGVVRLIVSDAVYYTFVADSRVIPFWLQDSIMAAEKNGEFDFEADHEYRGEP